MYKNKLFPIINLFFVILLSSCALDNMEAPDCHITGVMMYNGQPIGVKGTGPSVQLELWQAGFGKESAQTINVAQDGTFSTYVYAGDCRLITKKGIGPWLSADTLRINVKRNINVNYDITPYFTISNVVYEYNAQNNTLKANFTVTKIVEDAKVKSVGLLVNDTQFVDLYYNKKSTSLSNVTGDLSFTLDLSALTSAKFLFARVYVKADGVDEAAYSTQPYKVR